MNSKQSLISVLIIVLVLMLLIGGAAFAYFAADITTTNVTYVNSTLPAANSSFVTQSTNCQINPTSASMQQGTDRTAGTVAADTTCTLTVEFTGSTTSPETCTYDVVYELKDYTLTAGEEKEYTISGVKKVNGGSDSNAISETQLASTSATPTKLLANESITGTAASTGSVVYTFTEKWYNTLSKQNPDSNNHSGQTYSTKVYVDNIRC